jgi:hypothetical protein
MGHYTAYKLEMRPENKDLYRQICREWTEFDYALGCGQAKWYEHEEDMLAISRKHPETLFILSGEGEEGGNLWKKYFQKGLIQSAYAQIVYPEFDESKLGPPQDYVYRDGKWQHVPKVWNETQQCWETPSPPTAPKLKKPSRRDPEGEWPVSDDDRLC